MCGEAEDRGLPLGNLRDDNDATGSVKMFL